MKYLKTLFTLALLAGAAIAQGAISGQWLQHPTFDNSVLSTVATSDRVYFMGYNQNYQSYITAKSSTAKTLFIYDIEGDELVAANRVFNLTGRSIERIDYNSVGGYLFILYTDYDMDILFDSGEVANIPALKQAGIPGSKKVNGVSFDPDHNNIWIATDFGYILLNDQRREVEDSRNYGTAFLTAARVGDNVVLTSERASYIAAAADKRLNLTDYNKLDAPTGNYGIYPLGGSLALVHDYVNRYNYLRLTDFATSTPEIVQELSVYGDLKINGAKDGYMAVYQSATIHYTRGARAGKYASRPAIDRTETAITGVASWDQSEFFSITPRLGLRSFTSDGTITRNHMLPNAPNAYWSRAMVYHPTYGMLVNSHGVDPIFSGDGVNSMSEPYLLSAYKDGYWTPKSPAYADPAYTDVGFNPLGLLIDPADSKYVWSGSNYSGISRINLQDPTDILHYSFPGDPTSSLPGYVKTSDIQSAWSRLCFFSPPHMDSQNTMWSLFHNADGIDNLELRYMTDDDRRASRDAASARPWKTLLVRGVTSNPNCVFVPLTASVNRNLLLYLAHAYIVVYNTNGTPDVTSDDSRAVVTATFFDQDGGEVNLYQVNCTYEDPSTGFVWFGTGSGVYYLQPTSILKGQTNVNRIKVARNDGTSLADYLLNGVGVNCIIADPEGRKWFATTGAGIVVTSSDGRTVLGEFTTANSEIPSDNVYSICYNPATRSIMVSTENGIAEFFPGGISSSEGDAPAVRAYPNPVSPDYHGWVTIDGLPDNSYVKIVDASGNLVRELGRAETGSIQWDINNMHYRRVNTGVYYILSSPASGSGESNVAKILIMN